MTVSRDIKPVGEGDPLIFDAVLYPHRSLSPRGFWIVMSVVAGVSFAAGAAAVAIGAWPVFGFFGADVLLLAWCFRRNYWDARLYETVKMTPDALTVRRVTPAGKTRSWTFQPHWLRVELEEPIDRASQLAIASHGYRLSIGAFLSPDEKRDFARALGTALRQARTPDAA